MLTAITHRSEGKIKLELIDPAPFSEEEDRALDFGLKGVALSDNEEFYFGLVGTNAVGDREMIPFFRPENASFLEYDLNKLIYTLARPKRAVIGLYSSLPIEGEYDFMTRKQRNSWYIYDLMSSQFDVRSLDANFTHIGPEIDILMLVHPKQLNEASLYAIDQFILRGGKALFFVDPYAEVEVAIEQNFHQDRLSDKSSGLEKLFEKWGVTVSRTDVLADRTHALPVRVNFDKRPVTHLTVLGFNDSNFNEDDVVTRQLTAINSVHPGFISLTPTEGLTATSLIQSSKDSDALPVDLVKITMDPTQMLDQFTPDNTRKTVALRLQGIFPAAFETPLTPATDNQESQHLTQSSTPGNIIIVADADLLQDRLWVRIQNFMGHKIPTPVANNGDFVINAIDNLGGSNALISIRGRGEYIRPFEYVNQLRKEAEGRFRETEEKLVQRLQETEQRILELEKQRDSQSNIDMTPEQEAAIADFTQEKAQIRKQLREVRRQLDKNIEELGWWLRAINILLVPILVTLFGIAVFIIQVRRRKRTIAPSGDVS
jgi:ABC-type uncharacterized transport system involved in gliding motility auxiliary subunit